MMIFADFFKTAFGTSFSESRLTPAQCFQDVMQMVDEPLSAELELILWHLQGALQTWSLPTGSSCTHRVIQTFWASKMF